MIQAMKKNAGILAIFALLSTLLVSLTHFLTKDRIALQQQQQLIRVLNQVIDTESYNNDLYQSCTLVQNQQYLGSESSLPAYVAMKDGEATGIAIEAIAPDGYNGAIDLIVGLDVQGTVTGVRVLNHNETPGLGDKIDKRVTNWIDSFNGKQVQDENDARWAVRKDGGNFDQFTGATITPRAVIKAVKNVALFYQKFQQDILSQPMNCEGES